MTEDQMKTERMYTDLIDTFMTPGWAVFVSEIAGNVDSCRDNLETADSEADLYRQQGMLKILRNMGNFEAGMRAGYTNWVKLLEAGEFDNADGEEDDEGS